MDRSNWEHAGVALLMMAIVWAAVAPLTGWLLAHPAYIPMAFGATVGSVWFIAREHTQAEDRYVAAYGYRLVAPKWPEFRCLTPDNWTLNDVLDWVIAAIAVWSIGPAIVAIVSRYGGAYG